MENSIKLTYNSHISYGYTCVITEMIDDMSFVTKGHIIEKFNHYFCIDNDNDWKSEYIAIRIPGRTCGYVKQTPNHIIEEIEIVRDHDKFIKEYDRNVNDELKKFIGYKLIKEYTMS